MRFLVAAGLALLLTPLAGGLGRLLGLVDRPSDDGLKIHRDAVPVLGGFAVTVAALAALLLALDAPLTSVILAVMLAFGVGLADDVRGLSASSRVLALALAGGLLTAGGLRLELLGPFATGGTIALVLACANAVNLLDGQDGLAAGLAAIGAAGLAAAAAGDSVFGTEMGLAVAGALVGFVVWNMSPARIFLGNSGAYAVGTLLAALVVAVGGGESWNVLVGAATCLGVFALELAFTVARRLPAGRLLTGDRDHSYDVLARRGYRRTTVTLMLWAVGAALAGLGTALARAGPGPALVGPPTAIVLVAGVGLCLGFRMRRRSLPRKISGRAGNRDGRP